MDYSGKIIKKTPVVPSQQSASGVWSLDEAMQAQRSNTWPVANVPNPISRSLRFRSSASAYLNRTQGTSTNQNIGTWSFWCKRGALGATQRLFEGYTASSDTGVMEFEFQSDNTFYVGGWSTNWRITTQVFRDPSAWYHIVVAVDTTQATANNRIRVYVNGTEITSFSTTNNPTQNATFGLNNNSAVLQIGRRRNVSSNDTFFDGYMTEINFIDGQALTPSSFGGTNAVTGVWEPRQYTGTYGTNGYYLNFKDNTSTSTLGLDYSGNSNNWTTNNISLTAGSTYDSMLDVPTQWIGYNTGNASGATRGNYPTLNPLANSSATLSNGNLSVSGGNDLPCTMVCPSSGHWYVEFNKSNGNEAAHIGIYDATSTPATINKAILYAQNGLVFVNDSSVATFASYANGDIISMGVDIDTGNLYFSKNNVYQGSVGISSSGIALNNVVIGVRCNSGVTADINFGQRPFVYPPTAPVKSLCTTNLPSPTILQGNQYMDVLTWTGTGTTSSRTFTGLGFQPDFVWSKNRTIGYDHCLYDAVRGSGPTRELISNSDVAEGGGNQDQYGYLSSFNSDGFSSTVGSLGQNLYFNDTVYPAYVAWNWNAGGSTVTNTAGSISSQVRANPTAGFSIVTYTGTGANATVGHGLSVAPKMVIVKDRDRTTDWSCLAMPANNGSGQLGWIRLNTTNTWSTTAILWNNTAPTSSVFSIGTYDYVNQPSSRYVAYCFSEVDGYSKIGSYTGNGSTDGTFVYLGFRPEFVLIKLTNLFNNNWVILDAARNTFNLTDAGIYPNTSNGEETLYARLDFLSNGFKIRSTDGMVNQSSGVYLYMAFAQNPFKNALAR
jgi:hypothetical protein